MPAGIRLGVFAEIKGDFLSVGLGDDGAGEVVVAAAKVFQADLHALAHGVVQAEVKLVGGLGEVFH